jgi:hypothetical protein
VVGDLSDRRRFGRWQRLLVALGRSENPIPNELKTAAVAGMSTRRIPARRAARTRSLGRLRRTRPVRCRRRGPRRRPAQE